MTSHSRLAVGQLLAEVTRMVGTPVSHRAAGPAQAVHTAAAWGSKTVSGSTMASCSLDSELAPISPATFFWPRQITGRLTLNGCGRGLSSPWEELQGHAVKDVAIKRGGDRAHFLLHTL